MRAWTIAIVITIALAGCAAAPTDVASDPLPEAETAAPIASTNVSAPVHELGRAWTYRSEEFYNDDAEFTVVVARADGGQYLFAAGAEDDLISHALWGTPWYGPRDEDQNAGEGARPMLKFPLADGATWAYSDTITLTAQATTIQTPLGSDEGFIITGANDRMTIEIHYSPAVGAIVEQSTTLADGTVRDRVTMIRVENDKPWLWYELGALVVLPNPHEPQVFEVPAGYDHVIMSSGGMSGSRVLLQGPGGESWEHTFDGAEDWKHAMLPATEGRWVASLAGRPFVEGAPAADIPWPVGWGYAHIAGVSWVRS